jgi:TonB family protein
MYPPIARAAHVNGTVILLARFDNNGVPVHVRVVSGPSMLQREAFDFVKNWRVNEYSGSRECPIVVSFDFIGGPSAECGTPDDESQQISTPPQRIDLQHFVITSHNPCFVVMRDPAGLPVHNFLGHRWYSNR